MNRRKALVFSKRFNKKKRRGVLKSEAPAPNKILFLSSVFCARAYKEYLQLTEAGFEVIAGYSSSNNNIRYAKSMKYQYTPAGVKKIIDDVRPAIIHCHNSPNTHIVWARQVFKGPIIFDIHDARKPSHKKAVEAATYIYTVHPDYAEYVKTHFDTTKLIHCPQSVYFYNDFDKQPKLSDTDNEPHLCFIGSMYGRPTAHKWSKMFKEIANSEKIHIHAHTNYFHDTVKTYADKYFHAEQEIIFHNIPSTLSKYDAGLIPSGTAQSLPNKFFDYINAGIPIIADPARELVCNHLAEYDFGIARPLNDITKNDIIEVVAKSDNIDHNKIDITMVTDLPPYNDLVNKDETQHSPEKVPT